MVFYSPCALIKLCKIPSKMFVVQVVEVLATDDDDRSRGNGPSFVFRNNIVINVNCPLTMPSHNIYIYIYMIYIVNLHKHALLASLFKISLSKVYS